jgi:hypothetical protein
MNSRNFLTELTRRNPHKLKLDPVLDPPTFSDLVKKPLREVKQANRFRLPPPSRAF